MVVPKLQSVVIKLRVSPRGSVNEILGWKEDTLVVKTTAPPVEGAANAMVTKMLAKALGIRKSAVVLVSGEKSRDKTISVESMSIEEVKERIHGQLP